MTTWIFGVQENYPEHWDFAKRDQIWDLPSNREVLSGDLIYFWQSGDPEGAAYRPGLLGLARATSRPRRLKDDEPRPWTDAHPGNDRYKYRLDLEVIIGESSSTARWSTLQAHTGVPGMLNFGPQDVKLGDGERWLRWQLDSGETEDLSESTWSAVDDEDADEADGMEDDHRRRVPASVVLREGRGPFRKALLDAYDQRCAITGVSEPVLDAAHIRRYLGRQSNSPSNGILLRTDLHTLFDKHLLTVVYEGGKYHVRVADHLRADMYRSLDRQELAVMPKRQKDRPSPKRLAEHNEACREKWNL